ncbi:hypothetical protein O6H91_Y553200 [Diphasiastrum complanatum]|nr:hypothetical protein O6H91_Y553200 [Diphasiastrum complanatum]
MSYLFCGCVTQNVSSGSSCHTMLYSGSLISIMILYRNINPKWFCLGLIGGIVTLLCMSQMAPRSLILSCVYVGRRLRGDKILRKEPISLPFGMLFRRSLSWHFSRFLMTLGTISGLPLCRWGVGHWTPSCRNFRKFSLDLLIESIPLIKLHLILGLPKEYQHEV